MKAEPAKPMRQRPTLTNPDEEPSPVFQVEVADQPSIPQMVKAYVGGTVGASASIAKLLLVKRFGGNCRHPGRVNP